MPSVWGMILQWGSTIKSEHWAPCCIQTPSWYDWKIVESDVKPEQTTTCTIHSQSQHVVSTPEPRHDKTNKMSVRPAKTQISLGIRPVWSVSLLCAEWVVTDPRFLHADSEDPDQTGRMPRLIWVFAGRTATLFALSCRGSPDYLRLTWLSTDMPTNQFFSCRHSDSIFWPTLLPP